MKKLIFIISILTFLLALRLTAREIVFAAPLGNYLELSGGHLKAALPADNLPAGFTFEAWVKPDATHGEQTVLSVGDQATGKLNYELGLTGNFLFFHYRFGTNSAGNLIVGGGNLGEVIPGVWNHLAVAYSSSSIKLFLNGKESSPLSLSATLFPIGGTVVLGDSFLEPVGSTKIFKGKMDEVRISNITRNIGSLWEAGTYNNPLSQDANTVILWHLDEARGVVQAQDSSGHNYSGALIGSDSLIHFYGVLPTPTPFSGFVLPTIRWVRPVLPTLSMPNWNSSPTSAPAPIIALPTSSIIDVRSSYPRPTRSFSR